MKNLLFLSKYINLICRFLIMILLVIIAASMFVQVILRFIFSQGLPWVEEFARYGTIWVTMLYAPFLIKNDELLKVDFLDEYLPPNFLKYRDIFYRFVIIFIFIVLIKEGWLQALNGLKSRTVTLEISWFWVYLSVPVGSFLMLFEIIILIFKDLGLFKKNIGKLGKQGCK